MDCCDAGLLHDWQRTKQYLGGVGLGGTILAAAETTSTQLSAKAAARADAAHGTVAVSEHQTLGRGRRDRGWHSIPGRDLMFSVVLRPPIETRFAVLLNLAAALAVSRMLSGYAQLGDRAAIKWPNDVLVDGKKICGIICEAAGDEKRLTYAVLGIGVNTNRSGAELPPLDSPDRPGATSLWVETGKTFDMPRLLAALLTELDGTCGMVVSEEGRMALLDAYRGHCCTLGREIRIVTDEGEYCGTGVDVSASGALIADIAGARMTFDVGDVVHARLK